MEPNDEETAHGCVTDALVGQTIGKYHILSVIASGGMGTVYLAKQSHPSREVALKLIRAGMTSNSALRRFEFEAEVLARLRHPGIAQVFDAGIHGAGRERLPFFSMEYIPGAMSLIDYADGNGLSTRQRLELFAAVCDAVHHGHQKGVIHRDLKPGNVLVDASGRPKVIDFGVARLTDSDIAVTTHQTDLGQLIGTLQYMSPEQCEADPQDLDIRTDVYSLGVVLYELLSGQLPYDVRSDRFRKRSSAALNEAVRTIREETPARLGSRNVALRGDIETIALKAIEKDRDRRYQSATDLAQDIRRYLQNEPILARPPSLAYQLRMFTKRYRAAVAVSVIGATVIAVVLLVATGVSISFAVSEVQQRRIAETARTEAVFNHANTLWHDGDFASAETRYRRVHEFFSKEYGDESLEVAEILNNLAACLRPMARFKEAEQLHGDALAIRRRLAIGEKRNLIAQSLNNLALCLLDQDRYAEAEPLLDECLDLSQELGLDHSQPFYYARLLDKLAMCLAARGEFVKAKRQFLESLALKEAEYGNEHSSVAKTRHALAQMMFKQGDLEQAERWCHEALDLQVTLLREQHPDIADSLQLLGEIHVKRGEFGEAEVQLRKALDIRENESPPVPSRIAETQSVLGGCLVRLGRYEEAEPLLVDSWPIIGERWGEQQKHTLRALDRIISLYEAWDKPQKAAQYRAIRAQSTKP